MRSGLVRERSQPRYGCSTAAISGFTRCTAHSVRSTTLEPPRRVYARGRPRAANSHVAQRSVRLRVENEEKALVDCKELRDLEAGGKVRLRTFCSRTGRIHVGSSDCRLPTAVAPANLRVVHRGVPRHRVVLTTLLSLFLLFLQQEN